MRIKSQVFRANLLPHLLVEMRLILSFPDARYGEESEAGLDETLS
jgi:hypothetical protein